MAETAEVAQATPVYFRATEFGITDGGNHYCNEAFVASPAMLAHWERTRGVDAMTGRTLYVQATEAEYVAQEQERKALVEQDYYASRGGMEPAPETPQPETPQVNTEMGMRTAQPSGPLL